jgi:hypothetical protein
MKHTNTFGGQTAELLNDKAGVTYNYYLFKLQMGFCPVAVVLQ